VYRIVALAGPTCIGKTAIAVAAAKTTGAVIFPLDQLQRYRYLREGVGFDESTFEGVDYAGYQVLSPWEVSGPERYARWLGDVLPEEARDRPVLIEGGCTSYLKKLLELAREDPLFARIRFLALAVPGTASEAVARIDAFYDAPKIQRIIQEVGQLERRRFVSEPGLPFLEKCETLFTHPEHDDRNLAWAMRISAKVYCPAYLALKGRIEVEAARDRIVRNVRDIQLYQEARVAGLLAEDKIMANEMPVPTIAGLIAELQGQAEPSGPAARSSV